MAFVIVTDSATDLPKSIEEKYHLHIIPTPYLVNGVDQLDRVSMTTKEFYSLLEDNSNKISTYHINSYMFKNAFEPYAKRGDEVLYCCFSTGIAGTFNAASLAKEELLEEYPDFKLIIKDCRSASLGFGLIVYKLLKMQENGADRDTILAAADYYVDHISHVFTVETLEYLIRGGRVSKLSGTVGEFLQVKPILIVDREGKLEVLDKVRGRKKSLKMIQEYAAVHGVDFENQTIGICHAEDFDTMKAVEKELAEKIHPKEIIESCVGCAIGAHTGRGLIGIVFFDAGDGEFAEYL
ncbi:MAG: DegV family protein [Clostridiales bacterium]|nr:DegV family protein [Clostridiales bacterium]